ncbi:Protein DGS1 mitochondrial, partial [Bienertia sinuspersici]
MNIPSPSQDNDESRDLRTLTSFYSNYLWNRISNSPILGKLSNFYRQFGRARSRRQKLCLPLPLPSKSGSNVEKAYFMLFERGPRALIGEMVEFVQNFIAEDSSFQILCHSASGFISERVAVLDSIRCALATFLAQVYMVIDKQGEDLVAEPQKSLPSLLVTINGLFLDLEMSITQLHVSKSQVDRVGETKSPTLIFNKMTEAQWEQSQWTDDQIRDAIDVIYQNLQKLDSYLSVLVARHRKPRKMTQYWVRYTCGAVGLSVCSLWIVRHSRLVGSPDIDNWIREARESTVSFWTEHVEYPLLSIRDELFETFRKRHRGVMEADEVQLTANSLHRMLVAFCEQANGQKFPENVTDHELLEIVMGRYEKEMMHPLKSTFAGDLPRAMLIQ